MIALCRNQTRLVFVLSSYTGHHDKGALVNNFANICLSLKYHRVQETHHVNNEENDTAKSQLIPSCRPHNLGCEFQAKGPTHDSINYAHSGTEI